MAKSKYWDKRGKEHKGPFDTIVIGSGMGSMTAAALLSELGERVLVLEQHYEPGGYTHTFKRPGGYIWDVGVHAIGEVSEHTMTGRLLKKLTRGQLEWESLGEVYDSFHFPDGFDIDFPDNPNDFRANLLAAFPDEARAIGLYFDAIKDVGQAMKRYYASRVLPSQVSGAADFILNRKVLQYFERSAEDVLRDFTDNEKLRAVLCSQWGYYGSVPRDASFAIQALVARHFLWGAYYPVGGSDKIAEGLLGTVAHHGGWTRIASPVDAIIIEDGAAVGVEVAGEAYHADRIISGIGAQATLTRLLPASYRMKHWGASFEALEPAAAHVCLYLGFKGDVRAAGATAANQWFYNTWDQTIEAWDVAPGAENKPDAPILYCSFPSLKDSTHDPGPEQKHTGEVVTFVPWESFEQWSGSRWKKRGEDYEAFKNELQELLLQQFFEAMPELEPLVDYVDFSTPASTDYFNRAVGGSIYGLAPTPERYTNKWLRPKSPIPNLFLAGCDVCSPGVIGAMFGGVLAATAARPVDAGRYMRDIL